VLSVAEAKKLTPLVEQAILTIGCHREAFVHSEKILTGKLPSKKKAQGMLNSPSFFSTNQDVLDGLTAYATALGLNREKEIFERLAIQVSDKNILE
jgi:hypothetical protein